MKSTAEIFELCDGTMHEGIHAGTYGSVMVWDPLPFVLTPLCPRYIKVHDVWTREPVCEITPMLTLADYQEAVRRKLEEIAVRDRGVWWCFVHKRVAAHRSGAGGRCCDPSLAGIMMPCDVRWRCAGEAVGQ